MSRGACPAVKTLDLALRTTIPLLNGKFTDASVYEEGKNKGKHKISERLQTNGNPRHQLGVCLDILLFATDWSMYDKSVNWQKEKILGENLVKLFIELKDEMKWTEIIYEDRLFWEPDYYKNYTADKKHFTHIHIDWMINSLKGKGKSEDEIIKNSPQANNTSFSTQLTARLSQINQQWESNNLSSVNLAAIPKTYSPDVNPVGSWQVKVEPWTWIYTFDVNGKVTWRDPLNNETGKGTWKISSGVISFSWANSTTTEIWKLPINPTAQTGNCTMKGKFHALNAVRL
ncbi:MAG: hypothetical protein ACR2MG_03790 [Pyrinomonadaceae bacterium]